MEADEPLFRFRSLPSIPGRPLLIGKDADLSSPSPCGDEEVNGFASLSPFCYTRASLRRGRRGETFVNPWEAAMPDHGSPAPISFGVIQ